MSASGKARTRKGPHKVIKFPSGAPLLPELDKSLNEGIEKVTLDLCESLMNSDWQAFNMRPPREIFGIYVICKWYSKESQWVVLYVGRGIVKDKLEGNFSAKQRSPIANYLSSFPKESRNLIWIKWIKDPFYPYESLDMDEFMKGLQAYNNGELPAFNVDMQVLDEEIPADFSIIPEWHKKQKSQKQRDFFS